MFVRRVRRLLYRLWLWFSWRGLRNVVAVGIAPIAGWCRRRRVRRFDIHGGASAANVAPSTGVYRVIGL
jgi:hypothetical protein